MFKLKQKTIINILLNELRNAIKIINRFTSQYFAQCGVRLMQCLTIYRFRFQTLLKKSDHLRIIEKLKLYTLI